MNARDFYCGLCPYQVCEDSTFLFDGRILTKHHAHSLSRLDKQVAGVFAAADEVVRWWDAGRYPQWEKREASKVEGHNFVRDVDCSPHGTTLERVMQCCLEALSAEEAVGAGEGVVVFEREGKVFAIGGDEWFRLQVFAERVLADREDKFAPLVACRALTEWKNYGPSLAPVPKPRPAGKTFEALTEEAKTNATLSLQMASRSFRSILSKRPLRVVSGGM